MDINGSNPDTENVKISFESRQERLKFGSHAPFFSNEHLQMVLSRCGLAYCHSEFPQAIETDADTLCKVASSIVSRHPAQNETVRDIELGMLGSIGIYLADVATAPNYS